MADQRTRIIALVVAVVAVIAVGVFILWDDPDDPFGDDIVAADDRSSPPAATFDDSAETDDGTDDGIDDGIDDRTDDGIDEPDDAGDGRSTDTDPAIAREPVSDLGPASAVVDLSGDGPILVSTLDGGIHSLDLDTGESEMVLDLSGQVSFDNEQGLLGMAADPDEARLYVDFTDTGGDTEVRSWPLVDGVPSGAPDAGVLHLELGQPYANHNGGHLAFGPDGLLWIGTGDGGAGGDPGEVAQDPSSLLGKMLRVEPDPDGGVAAPSSNPDWGGRPEIWAIGLRNPWRYSFDRATGRLWVADVGQSAVEEVSVVGTDEPMPNFGWDDMEGDQPFEGSDDPAFVAPVVTYGHDDAGACSIAGGYVYRGDDNPSLHGWYVFGDYCSGWIRAVPAGDPTQEPVDLTSGVGRLIAFGELEDGELLVFSQSGISRLTAP